jgi:hypothetical protein
MSAADSMESDYFTQSMSLLCPLDDEHLPMEAANLKTRQVRRCGKYGKRQRLMLKASASCNHCNSTAVLRRMC